MIIPTLGIIIPEMGNIEQTSVADALFSGVQKRVLGLMFTHPDEGFYVNQIVKLAHTGRGALQRELDRLTRSGLLRQSNSGNQKIYQANRDSFIFSELRAIVLKTVGLADVLREALTPLGDAIRVAFIYGSVAKGSDTAASDIDLMIVSDSLTYSGLFECVTGAEATLARKVNPTLYTEAEFRGRLAEDSTFITRVLAQPIIPLIGDAHEYTQGKSEKPGEDRPPDSGAAQSD